MSTLSTWLSGLLGGLFSNSSFEQSMLMLVQKLAQQMIANAASTSSPNALLGQHLLDNAQGIVGATVAGTAAEKLVSPETVAAGKATPKI